MKITQSLSGILILCLLPFLLASCATQSSSTTPDTPQDRPATQRQAPSTGLKAYNQVITSSALSSNGLFDVHVVGDKIYYEIPDSLLGRELLSISRVAMVPTNFSGFTSSGAKTAEQVFTFERVRNKIVLKKKSYNSVADDDKPISLSVRANNFEPIIASFDIQTEGQDGNSVVIEINSLYSNDIPAVSGVSGGLRSAYQVRRLDPARSYIDTVRTFPQNIEARHVMTYEAVNPPSDGGTNTFSILMNQSMILLPKEPMRPRFADYRVGWFTVNQLDFNLDDQKAPTRSLIRRWRLEPSDPDAYARGELVEPVKPIVYYVDPGTPEEYRDYVLMGIEDWQATFETAGFKNAIIGKLAPTPEEDPDFTPEDVRYNMVRWVANLTRNATGPSEHDPRTGEIIASDIFWYHNHIRSYRNRLMIETGASNPKARTMKMDMDQIGEAVRQVIAHEIGHALGLPHNMKANDSFPVDSLRSPTFTSQYGVSATIMDYARQNYIAQPGDGIERFIRMIGPYDHYAINWGYRVIPDAATPEAEVPTLNQWILDKADDPMYRFGSSTGYDPSAQTEALSDDNVRASTYGMMNLQRVVPNLLVWTTTPGQDYSDLQEIYGELIGQWNRYVNHVITNIGGVKYERKATDQEGPLYTPVDKEYQKKAVQFMNEHAFTTPHWLLNEDILRRIEHAGAVDRIRALQGSQLSNVMNNSRMIRMIEDETFRGNQAYTLAELMSDLRSGLWSELLNNSSVDTYRRNLQRVYLDNIGNMIANESGSNAQRAQISISDIQPMLRDELRLLKRDVERAVQNSPDRTTRIHLQDVIVRIDNILDN
jgi:hypothetical protein